MLLCVFTTVQAIAQTDEKELFLKAQETYQIALRQGGQQKVQNMLKAAAQFEVLADKHGIENGYLFYNIGNCYFEAGESGKAVLYYLKAKRLISGFKDLENNLEVAKAGLNVPEAPKTWWSDIIQGIFFWHYMLDYSTRRILFVISFSLIWLFLIAMIFLRSFLLKGGVILSVLLTFFFVGSYLMSCNRGNLVPINGAFCRSADKIRFRH